MTRYNNSNGNTVPFSDLCVQIALAANTELTWDVPGANTNSYRLDFSWDVNDSVWVGYKVTATLPAPGTITQTNGVERNPDLRFARGGDTLHFISRATVTDAGISLLQLAS